MLSNQVNERSQFQSVWIGHRLLGVFVMAIAFLPVFEGGDALSGGFAPGRIYEALMLLVGAFVMTIGVRSLPNVWVDPIHRWTLVPFSFFLWAFGSAAWSMSPTLTISKSLEFLTIIVGSLLFVYWSNRPEVPQIDVAWQLARVLLLIIGVGLALNVFYWGNPLAILGGDRERLVLAYAHPGTAGGIFALALVCCATSRIAPWVRILLVVGCFLLMILADARMGMGAVVLALYAVLLTHLDRGWRLFTVWLTAVSGFAYILYGIVAWRDDPFFQIRPLLPEDFTNLNGRTGLWDVGYQLITERPILGYGYYASRFVLLDRIPWAGNLHNGFLEILLSTGAVGLLLTIVFAIQVAWLAWRARSRLLLGLWVYMLASGVTAASWLNPSLDNLILLIAVGNAYLHLHQKAAGLSAPRYRLPELPHNSVSSSAEPARTIGQG